jgi:hypothetical protein
MDQLPVCSLAFRTAITDNLACGTSFSGAILEGEEAARAKQVDFRGFKDEDEGRVYFEDQ